MHETTVKVILQKDLDGTYALSVTPSNPITLAEQIEIDENFVDEMNLIWKFEEHPDNPDRPNAKRLVITFKSKSPFFEDTTGVYDVPIGPDGAEVATSAVRSGVTGDRPFKLFKYDIEVFAIGTERNEQGELIDERVLLDPHVRIKRGLARAKDLVD